MRKRHFFGAFGIFLLLCIFSFKWQQSTGFFNYHATLWADKSGYYIYLPATFIYGFDASAFEEKIYEKVGWGFTLDATTNKVRTKYTCGIAILQAPFFLSAHAYAKMSGIKADGFSPFYQEALNIAGIFYLTLGLLLLYLFLRNYFNGKLAFLTLAVMLFGSNLYWYGVLETAMSHIYSFFLFAVVLYCVQQLFLLGKSHGKYFYFLVFSAALIVLIRPTNIIFLTVIFLWDIRSGKEIIQRLKYFLQPRHFIAAIVIAFLVFLPQMLYWNYLHNSYITYSYGNEGFNHWKNPYILSVLFSTNNGWLTYSPIHLFSIAGVVLMFLYKKTNSFLFGGIMVAATYIFASWHAWNFGCSFGARSFVEYYSLFCFPLAFSFQKISVSALPPWSKNLTYLLIFAMVFYSLKLTYIADSCWFNGSWDWAEFWEMYNRRPFFQLFK